jgi:hypothetical protein
MRVGLPGKDLGNIHMGNAAVRRRALRFRQLAEGIRRAKAIDLAVKWVARGQQASDERLSNSSLIIRVGRSVAPNT